MLPSIIGLLAFTAIAPSPTEVSMNQYVNNQYGYAICYPSVIDRIDEDYKKTDERITGMVSGVFPFFNNESYAFSMTVTKYNKVYSDAFQKKNAADDSNNKFTVSFVDPADGVSKVFWTRSIIQKDRVLELSGLFRGVENPEYLALIDQITACSQNIAF